MLAVFSLVYAATDTAFCLAPISLGLSESRILAAAPVDTRPRTPLISFCIVQLPTLCSTRSLATLYLYTISVPGLGSYSASEAPWSSAMHAPIPWKGSGKNNSSSKSIHWTKAVGGQTFSTTQFYEFHDLLWTLKILSICILCFNLLLGYELHQFSKIMQLFTIYRIVKASTAL